MFLDLLGEIAGSVSYPEGVDEEVSVGFACASDAEVIDESLKAHQGIEH